MSLIKEQTDSIINSNGLCPRNERDRVYNCSDCLYEIVCFKSMQQSYDLITWAKSVRDHGYTMDHLLFELLL